MSAALNNVTAPDEFGELKGGIVQGQLLCLDTARIRLQINNQAIYWRRGRAQPGGQGIFWYPPEFAIPNVFSFNDYCDYIQIKAAIKAAEIPVGQLQAQVTIATRTLDELSGSKSGQ